MASTAKKSKITLDQYVPVNLFGKDHWSTLAYIETVMTDLGGFQVGFDPRMRQNRRSYRVMTEQCPKPRRATMANAMQWGGWDNKYSTVLKDKTMIENHDDWACVQDMAEAGFLEVFDTTKKRTATAADCEPGTLLHLSPLGRATSNKLREHKAGGGTFSNFEYVVGAKIVKLESSK